jgi:hypothetical protein
VFDGRVGVTGAPEVVLDHKRSQAGLTWEALILGAQAIGYAIFPALLIVHPHLDSPLLWFVGGPLVIASALCAFLAAWLAWGRERITLHDCHAFVVWSIGVLKWSQGISLQTITRIAVLPRGRREGQNDVFGFGHRALLIASPARRLRCCVSIADGQVRGVASRLRLAVRECGGAVEQGDEADEAR